MSRARVDIIQKLTSTSVPLPRRGRPRKFAGPSKPVTITLPTAIIEALTSLDGDLSRAIVRLAQPHLPQRPQPPAELLTFGSHAVIVVKKSRTLERRTGVSLVPLHDGRALISFERGLTTASLELLIADALDDRALAAGDRDIFQAIADILRTARRASNVALLQRSIIVLRSRPAARDSSRSSR